MATPTRGGHAILAPPAAADLDGDGLNEVIVLDQGGLIAVFDRFGRMIDGWPVDLSLELGTPFELVIVPLRDGTQSIAIGTAAGLVRHAEVVLYDARGRVLPGWPRGAATGFQFYGLAAGDLDGDNSPEIIGGDGTNVWAFGLDGETLPGWPVSLELSGDHSQPLVADVTGDGRPDILMQHDTSGSWGTRAWEADGTPVLGLSSFFTQEACGQRSPTLGDLNSDGLIDLAIATESAGSIFLPGRVHVFSLDVPLDESTMHWPTHAHDYARTSTWSPPTKWFGGRGVVGPRRLRVDTPRLVEVAVDAPEEAPVELPLSVVAVGGLKIPALGLEGDGAAFPAGEERRGREVSLPGEVLLSAFLDGEAEHPEILLTDDEIRSWLATESVPPIPPGELRTLWLTVESERSGIRQLKAHVPMALCRAAARDGSEVFGVGGASCANSLPVAAAQVSPVVDCTSAAGGEALLDGRASQDQDSTPGTHDDLMRFEWFEDFGRTSQRLIGEGEMLTVHLPMGAHAITLRVTDLFGETSTDERVVTVVDRVPPELGLTLEPEELWPPDGGLRPVEARVFARDACADPSPRLESIVIEVGNTRESEARTADTSEDIVGADIGTHDTTFELRAVRVGTGEGRAYRITYSVRDPSGNETRTSAQVTVPHDRRP